MPGKLVVILLGLAALVLNPFVACSHEPPWRFGANELRAAIEGTWTVTVPARGPDDPALTYTVHIRQGDGSTRDQRASASSLVTPAAACGDRSFVRTAAACMDRTEMPLDVQIVAGPLRGETRGALEVVGRSFLHGRVELTLGASRLTALVSPEGDTSEVMFFHAGSDRRAALVRVAPAAPRT